METSTTYQNTDCSGDLTTVERYTRAAAALVLILYPMLTTQAPLGLIAVLPLIAIYPMFTAVVGWDPVRYVLNNSETAGINQKVARVGLVIIGTGLIGATMLTTVNPIGGLAVLALLGILPLFVAIFGENPITALIESSRKAAGQDIDQRQESGQSRVVEYTPRAGKKSSQQHLPTHHEAA